MYLLSTQFIKNSIFHLQNYKTNKCFNIIKNKNLELFFKNKKNILTSSC